MRDASMYCGLLSRMKAWSGVLVVPRPERQTSLLGASNTASDGGGSVRFQ